MEQLDTKGGYGTCTICQHPFDPHAIIATTPGGPLGGGIILCPEKGCPCFTTWSVDGLSEPVFVPDQDEIDRLRAMVQE